MRKYIDLVNNLLTERIIYRERLAKPGGDGRIVAVNPTKAEWDQWFPKGAGGVLCQNGLIAVGAGSMLPHDEILDLAKIASNQEKYRLQLGRRAAFVELWLFNDDWQEAHPPEEEVRAFCVKKYGETIEQIEAQLKAAVTPFMGDVPVKAIPLGDDQDPLFSGDAAFIHDAFSDLWT
jgi:hypothetical protein